MHRLPSPAEADVIRHYAGIPKKREISDQERERLRGLALVHGFRVIVEQGDGGRFTRKSDPAATITYPEVEKAA